MPRLKLQDIPQRSCLGCRTSRDKGSLIRFVLSPQGEIVPDLEAKLPGRGAYTCISRQCLLMALKQRQFSRAFKCEVSAVSADEMSDHIVGIMRNRILGLIGLANRAGKTISGGSMVTDAVRSAHKPGLVLLACDVSPSIGEKIELQSKINNVVCIRILMKDDFGAILGKAPRSAVALKSGGFVGQLKHEIERYRNFLGEV